jgi:uncharacterized protein
VLTADLVNARKKKGELVLVKLDDDGRARATELASRIVSVVESHVGRTRGEVDLALDAIDAGARDRRLKDGLVKLALDRCDLDADSSVEPARLRKALFERAAQARRDAEARSFDRAAIVQEIATANGLDAAAVERGIFADLREAHELRRFEPTTPRALVATWEHAQAQAVLLRAVSVTVDVTCVAAGAVRALFRRLKFLRLLFQVTKGDGPGAFRIVIDGPFSLFDSVTKYGLQLALVLPALEACDHFRLEANVRWGQAREALVFRLEGGAAAASAGGGGELPLPDEVAALVRAWNEARSGWKIAPSADVLDLPGVGVCIPDLVFEKDGARVHLEVMGYWSRDAVWRRVELVQQGLAARVLFAVSARLRVSEEALGDEHASALYVYKGQISARAIEERLAELAARAAGERPPGVLERPK